MLPSDKRYLSRFAVDPETEFSWGDLSGVALSNLFDAEIDPFVDEDIFGNEELTGQEGFLVEKKQ
jgi:hypothetical protein